ncbi:MAG: sigma-70 family RNA polymerase sigma factor [Kiritimatiellae bacterium]|nr:sigma-70 family RNA polymerase sigma factor [Kiritimatiellia bacterium]
MADPNLERLAVEAASGDMDALEALLRGVHGHLLAFLHAVGVPENDVEDVAQDAVLRMYRSLSRYQADKAFLPWLRGVARHAAQSYWRHHLREARRLEVFRLYLDEVVQAEPLEWMAESEEQAQLRECVDNLPEQQKRIVILRYFRGLNSTRIAETLRMKATTVRQTLSRVREALRVCVETAR